MTSDAKLFHTTAPATSLAQLPVAENPGRETNNCVLHLWVRSATAL
jgi:hypothetical protein